MSKHNSSSKYNPTSADLGFNPYVLNDETYDKLNYSHYSPENFEYRRRINKWKKKNTERAKLAKAFGIEYNPPLMDENEILSKINFKF